jgi:hypothetical protein
MLNYKFIWLLGLIMDEIPYFKIDYPGNLIRVLKANFPNAEFNLDIARCDRVLKEVIKPEAIDHAFVTGGFFTLFNEKSPLALLKPELYKKLAKEYGMNVFFLRKLSNEFKFETIVKEAYLDKLTIRNKLDRITEFQTRDLMLRENENAAPLRVEIHLSPTETGFYFLHMFDYETCKIFYTPKVPNKIYVPEELLEGRLRSRQLDNVSENSIRFNSKKRLFTQKCKGFWLANELELIKLIIENERDEKLLED